MPPSREVKNISISPDISTLGGVHVTIDPEIYRAGTFPNTVALSPFLTNPFSKEQ
jgi:hypothetical protein